MIFTKHVIKFFVSIVVVVGISSPVLLGSDVASFPARWNRVNVNLARLLTSASQPDFHQSKQALDEAIQFVSTNIATSQNFVGAVIGRGFSWNDAMSSLREAFTKLSAICPRANEAMLAATAATLKQLENALKDSGSITVVRYADPMQDPVRDPMHRGPLNREEALALLEKFAPFLPEISDAVHAAGDDASDAAKMTTLMAESKLRKIEALQKLFDAVRHAQRVVGDGRLALA